jgi:hypothetical protein
MTKLHSVFSFFVVAVCLFSGCGGGARVTGHVQFDDGTPLTVGEVIFESAAVQARGPIDSSGNYVMGTIKEGDGVPMGQYRVYVSGAEEPTGKEIPYYAHGSGRDQAGATRPEMRAVIDIKATQPATSGLTCDVKGSTKFNITVSKPSSSQ